MTDREATIQDNIWIPGHLEDLTTESLDVTCGHLCPWWFIIEAANKILKTKTSFTVDHIFRNQRIPLFQRVTNTQFTAQTTRLALQELTRFVLISFCFSSCTPAGTPAVLPRYSHETRCGTCITPAGPAGAPAGVSQEFKNKFFTQLFYFTG